MQACDPAAASPASTLYRSPIRSRRARPLTSSGSVSTVVRFSRVQPEQTAARQPSSQTVCRVRVRQLASTLVDFHRALRDGARRRPGPRSRPLAPGSSGAVVGEALDHAEGPGAQTARTLIGEGGCAGTPPLDRERRPPRRALPRTRRRRAERRCDLEGHLDPVAAARVARRVESSSRISLPPTWISEGRQTRQVGEDGLTRPVSGILRVPGISRRRSRPAGSAAGSTAALFSRLSPARLRSTQGEMT